MKHMSCFAILFIALTHSTSGHACSQMEFLRASLSDGQTVRHVFFASIPCRYEKVWEEKLEWEAFRYRRIEEPGVKGFTRFEYLGYALNLGSRKIGIKLTDESLRILEKDGLDMENVPIARKHALMVLKKDKPISEIMQIAKDPVAIDEYVASHLIFVANPESVGKPLID